jgi:hypothetical protein
MVRALSLTLLLLCAACVEQPSPVAPPPLTPQAPLAPAAGPGLDYAAPGSWVCRGDLPTDACRQEMNAIELRPDGSRVSVPFAPATNADTDCFYVYPTVDLRMTPGTHTDFTDTSAERGVTRAQVGRFSQMCRVFAPLYRQATFGTLLTKDPQERLPPLQLAYEDVLRAFDDYVKTFNGGRRIVMVGHSQGGGFIVRLLKDRFDADPALRARLVVALPIGSDFTVGQLPNVPVCARDDQTACVITFKSFLEGSDAKSWSPIAAGKVNACVNPTDVAGNGKRILSQAAFPTRDKYGGPTLGAVLGDAPFLLVDEAYSAQCQEGIDGFRYLAVRAIAQTPLPLTNQVWRGPLGLHALDMQLAQGDLLEIVRKRLGRR